ncbi:glycylpeptide N-tetradecanoyltransferase [Lophium mytilinum]|uniref:Glycylpeptide N-tetradecanoyltransferase n=1 Tax=Lophium mytilinum TaxID=390894 RepID=A0A6A6RAD7_9PEZI|nr:glycylpeptide N-tetradecanoyltransferase [Lophium mytilinum]
MPAQESKPGESSASGAAAAAAIAESTNPSVTVEDDSAASSGSDEPTPAAPSGDGTSAPTKKKSSKKRKLKAALTGKSTASSDDKDAGEIGDKLSKEQLAALLETNPALKQEMDSQASDKKVSVQELLRKLTVSDVLTGTAPGGKNKKDMASHAFWNTQPVTKFDEAKGKQEDGAIKEIDLDRVGKEPSQMYPGFEWVTMDLEDEKQLDETYELLTGHYVEDDDAQFRFNYSRSFLDWALKSPGWKKEWHVGVRASASGKLVAFISAIPVELRVREKLVHCSEVNFLVVHKKLRSKRLAPVLIKEITRRCYLEGIFQAIYTAGVLIPTPISTCRYFHRALDWEKLYECKFSHLPPGSTKQRQVIKYKLPERTNLPGLRPMENKDIDNVLDLLKRYLATMQLAQIFTREEVEHWLLPSKTVEEQVVWSYVVEDPNTKKITDYVSFYCLESTVINHKKHKVVRAAYLYYYATETAFDKDKTLLKPKLNALIKDALILAKNAKFDVFNALTLLDNPLFLEEQKFGAGDGQLNFYLFNYRTAPLPGGLDARNLPSEKNMRGVGVVML